MTLKLRYMTYADINQVVAIDKESFETAWSSRSYAYEIGESTYSYMVVLDNNQPPPLTGWKRFIRSFGGNGHTPSQIVSYGGLWRIMDEAHISTIATHTDWRGQGYGEVVLAAMIRRAMLLSASYIVLEVRVSNTAAQNLYHKYEFEIVDTKQKYYRDNNEDAYDMRLNLENNAMQVRFQERFNAIKARLPFDDAYTEKERPRP